MTRFMEEEIICPICGKKFMHDTLMSTNSHGIDLDTRPRGMQRSTLGSELCICPECKYVAYNMHKPVSPNVREYVCSDKYDKSINPNTYLSASTGAFKNLGEIFLMDKEYASAFFAFLKAAWVADDTCQIKEALSFRRCALEILPLVPRIKMDESTRKLLSIDLLRRSGNFEEALRTCKKFKPKQSFFALQVKYEEELIMRQDSDAHEVCSSSAESLSDED